MTCDNCKPQQDSHTNLSRSYRYNMYTLLRELQSTEKMMTEVQEQIRSLAKRNAELEQEYKKLTFEISCLIKEYHYETRQKLPLIYIFRHLGISEVFIYFERNNDDYLKQGQVIQTTTGQLYRRDRARFDIQYTRLD